jgi:hypothetical protein
MQPFVINSHDRIVFPSNLVPELDQSVIDSLEQLDGAPTGPLRARGGLEQLKHLSGRSA